MSSGICIYSAPPRRCSRHTRLLARILADGYQEGPPPALDFLALAGDISCCAETSCPRCGALSLQHEAFHKVLADRTAYRALMVCNECSYAEEM